MNYTAPRYILLLTGLLIFFNLFDAASTTFLIATGSGYELNPIMAYLIEKGIGWFLFYKIICVTGAAIIFLRYHQYAFARFSLFINTIFYGALFVYYVVIFTSMLLT